MRQSVIILAIIVSTYSAKAQYLQQEIVYFDFDKYELKSEEKDKLDALAMLSRILQLKDIEIYGHTDAFGSNDYNDWLGDERADAVMQYLIRKGIPKDNIIVRRSYGETKPAASNTNASGRQLNRRVEIMLCLEPKEGFHLPLVRSNR